MNAPASNIHQRPLAGFAVKYALEEKLFPDSPDLKQDILSLLQKHITEIHGIMHERYGVSIETIEQGLSPAAEDAAEWLRMPVGAKRQLFLNLALGAAEAAQSHISH